MKQNYDLHVHIALPEKELTDAKIKEKLLSYKDAGVLYLRDGGDNFGVSKRAKKIAEEIGLDYKTPIFAIYKEGHYGKLLGKSYKDFDEFKRLVDEAQENGADFIKLILSGIVDFNNEGKLIDGEAEEEISATEISQMVGYVHGKGLSVMAHVNGTETIKAAIAAGVDTLEHGFFMDEDAASMLASSDTVWVPTIAPVAALLENEDFNKEVIKKILGNHVNMVYRAWYLGAMIGLGTDAGSLNNPHVDSIDKEYLFLKTAINDQEFDAHLEMSKAQVEWKF